jgi:FG-GAP-like repeat
MSRREPGGGRVRTLSVAGVVVLTLAVLTDPTAAQTATFVDLAGKVGLAQSTQSLGATIADFNDDDLPDIMLNRQAQAPPSLYVGNADGTFTLDTTAVFGSFTRPSKDLHLCSSADVNDDGLRDVYCAVGTSHQRTTDKSNYLWIQKVDGSFANRAAAWGVADPAGRGRDALFLDVNKDGRPDLFVYNAKRTDGVSAPSRLFVNTGGEFVPAPSYGLDGAFWSLLRTVPELQRTTWNGHLAILAVTVAGPQLFVQRGGPGTAFKRATPAGWPTNVVQGARLVDIDRDGVDDLVTVTKRRVEVRRRTGDSSLSSAWSSATPGARSVAVADATRDELPDLYVTTWSQDLSNPNPRDFLFVNAGSFAFRSAPIPQASTGQGASASVVPYGPSHAFLVSNGPSRVRGPIQLISAARGS